MTAASVPAVGAPLLLPFDGSTNAEAVLPYVSLLAGPDRDVILLQVIAPGQTVSNPLGEVMLSAEEVQRTAEAAARQDLERLAARLSAIAPGLRIEQTVETGDPWQRIAEVATQRQVATILLASQGASAAAAGGFGSVVGYVVRTAPVPVMIVNPAHQTAGTELGRLVVAHDGSERAASVLPMIQTLAKRLDAHVHIVAVVEDEQSPLPASVAAAIEPHLREEAHGDTLNVARSRVEAAGAGLMREGLSASWQVLSGPAAATIIDACDAHDVLAITSHGMRGSSWLLGSVAEKLIREAHVPVILLRTPPEPAPGPTV